MISVIAMVGGFMVFWGLWIEKQADKSAFLNVDDFRSSQLKAKRGWNILMWGIAVETAVAGAFAARDGWEIRQIKTNEAKNSPLNQIISDVSAFAYFEVDGDSVPDIPTPKVRPFFGMAQMYLCDTNPLATVFPILAADNFDRGHAVNSEGRSYFVRFQATGLSAMWVGSNNDSILVKKIIDVTTLYMSFRFLTNTARIHGGNVVLVVNGGSGGVRRKFLIPAQYPKMQFANSPPDSPRWLIATNSSNRLEK